MSTTALDGLLDPLASSLDALALQQIIEFRISSEVQARVDYLAKRANNGELTPDEDAEYEYPSHEHHWRGQHSPGILGAWEANRQSDERYGGSGLQSKSKAD